MEILNIGKIVEITNGKLINGDINQEIENFSKDTRTLKKGDIYVGIKGEKFDGNQYYKEALRKGAIACILDINDKEKKLEEHKNIILVEDTIKALQKLAAYKRSLYDIPVIAVTGSVGKTSTKDMVASVVAQKYKVLKTEGNNNNHIGLPLTLLKLKDHTAVVIEMGMNHFGEISLLTNIAKPTACVLTNIGTSHIGNLGSRENILKAKLEILEGMKKDGIIILNNDNDLLYKWGEENKEKYNIKSYAIKNKADYKAYNITEKEDGSTYNVELEGKEQTIKVPTPGTPFIYNSLCAIGVGELLEIEEEKIIKGISEMLLTKNRMEIIKTKDKITILNDSYNASLDSVKPALEQLKRTSGNQKIAVLGDMLELGEYSEELHRSVGKEVVKNEIDILITVGKEAENIADEARLEGMNEKAIYICQNIYEAENIIKMVQTAENVILLKASNSMHFNELAQKLVTK